MTMGLTRKDQIIIEAEKEIIDLIPRLKGIYAGYAAYRDYRSIRNLALFANKIKHECMRIMGTFDYIDPEQRTRDNELLS